jgi:hypothetical protein
MNWASASCGRVSLKSALHCWSRRQAEPLRARCYVSEAKIFRGSVLLTGGEAITQACSLIRNMILARILTKADYGTAALLGMTVSIFEIGGRLSIEQLLVQSKHRREPRVMAVAHFVQSMLGLVSAALVFVTAGPMAVFFGVPDAAWALGIGVTSRLARRVPPRCSPDDRGPLIWTERAHRRGAASGEHVGGVAPSSPQANLRRPRVAAHRQTGRLHSRLPSSSGDALSMVFRSRDCP